MEETEKQSCRQDGREVQMLVGGIGSGAEVGWSWRGETLKTLLKIRVPVGIRVIITRMGRGSPMAEENKQYPKSRCRNRSVSTPAIFYEND